MCLLAARCLGEQKNTPMACPVKGELDHSRESLSWQSLNNQRIEIEADFLNSA